MLELINVKLSILLEKLFHKVEIKELEGFFNQGTLISFCQTTSIEWHKKSAFNGMQFGPISLFMMLGKKQEHSFSAH